MRVDFEMLALELTAAEYSEYLSYNNTDTLKCCWSDDGTPGYQGHNLMAVPHFGESSDFNTIVKRFGRAVFYQQATYNEEWRNSLSMIAEFQPGGFGRIVNYYYKGTTILMSRFHSCLNCGSHQNTWFDDSSFSGDSYIAFKQGSAIAIKNDDEDALEGTINSDQFSW